MELIKKIDLTTKKHSKIESRKAARAIVVKGQEALMLYIKKFNIYSFPGGGIELNETLEETCVRELQEETGAQGIKVISEFGYIDEYRDSTHSIDQTYNLQSYYYNCDISDLSGKNNLQGYETEIGITPVWVRISDALRHNENVILNDEKEGMFLSRCVTILQELESRYNNE